jgi:hypothetical protein
MPIVIAGPRCNAMATRIIGPVVWPAAHIPDSGTWHHPCLLAEIRTDNDDSAGGPDSVPVQSRATMMGVATGVARIDEQQ